MECLGSCWESIVFLTNVYICRDEEDKSVWKPSPNGAFSVKAFRDVVEEMSQQGGAPPSLLGWVWLHLG